MTPSLSSISALALLALSGTVAIAQEYKADIHIRMGRRIIDRMDPVRGRVAEPRSAQTTSPLRGG